MGYLLNAAIRENSESITAKHIWRVNETIWKSQVKTNGKEFITRFRPILVKLGNYQQPGIDYVESFSPVGRTVTLLALVYLATESDWCYIKEMCNRHTLMRI